MLFSILLYICLLFIAFWCAYALANIFFVNLRKDDAMVLVTLKNQKEELDVILRDIIWDLIKQYGYFQLPNILIVDLEKAAATSKQIKQIVEKIPFIKFTDDASLANLLD